jgi:hypothetical protein
MCVLEYIPCYSAPAVRWVAYLLMGSQTGQIPKNIHSWECKLKKVAPQKQNAICKTRAQYAKRNCAFELFTAHCATINAKNASFHKKIATSNLLNKIVFNLPIL